jgi:spore maturation protein CgeB
VSAVSRILICGASPDNQNRNTVLRNYVAEGFSQLEGMARVFNVPLEYASDKARECTPDLIFSNDRWCAEHYDHPYTYHLPLAASAKYHYREIKADDKDTNVFFCGVAFPNRVRLLRDLAKPLMASKAVVLGADWPTAELPFCRNKRIPNEKLSGHYSRAWVTLNMGRDFHYANERYKLDASTPGPRTFEAAMAGTTQALFVESLEIIDYYQPGSEILLYDSVDEFTHQMAAMMENRERCLAIAKAAQQRTMRDHTYKCRAETILRRVSQCRGG